MKRIAVIGTSCAGKSTFSQKLSIILGYPYIELDSLFWGHNWTKRKEFLDDVRICVQEENWILDGNYGSAREFIWNRATTIIILNLPFYHIFYRAIFRTLKRILTKEAIFNSNVETFNNAFFSMDGIPYWVIKTYRKHKKKYKQLVNSRKFSHIDFIELKSSKEVTQYLTNLHNA